MQQINISLRRRSAAARLLGLRIRIPPRTWLLVFSKCCVFSGTGLCDGPIPLPEKSYRSCVCIIELSGPTVTIEN